MAAIFPIRATHYNPTSIEDLGQVITPPYDVIKPAEMPLYWNRSPYNFAHVILRKNDAQDYLLAASLLEKWRGLKVLVEDEAPSFYIYQQAFSIYGALHRRTTLLCSVQLHEFSEGVIKPHENIYTKFKDDRLKILTQTKCQLSPIFGMVKDEEGFLHSSYERWSYSEPTLKAVTDDGITHSVWRINPTRAKDVVAFFIQHPIYIVDGHHRYQSALAYAKENGHLGKDAPCSSMLFAIATAPDPALVIFPTHRVVKKGGARMRLSDLETQYEVSPMTFEELETFVRSPQELPHFALYCEKRLVQCVAKDWRSERKSLGNSLSRLAVVWSDKKLLPSFFQIDDSNRGDRIVYEKDLDLIWKTRDEAEGVVFLPPLSVNDVMNVADENGFLPQKSTFFIPKLASGLIFRRV